jgi:hypothetical protein
MSQPARCDKQVDVGEPIASERSVEQPSRAHSFGWGRYPSDEVSQCAEALDEHDRGHWRHGFDDAGFQQAFNEVQQRLRPGVAGILGTAARAEISSKIYGVIAGLIAKRGPAEFVGLTTRLEEFFSALTANAARQEIQSKFTLFVGRVVELCNSKAIAGSARSQLEKHLGSIRKLEGLE